MPHAFIYQRVTRRTAAKPQKSFRGSATLGLGVDVFVTFLVMMLVLISAASGDEATRFEGLQKEFAEQTHPILEQFCLDCHSTDDKEGELDLERFASVEEVRRDPQAWLKIAEMLDNGEMPPEDSKQPSAEQRKQLRSWVESYLNAEALAHAGDPGPVILRRLSNDEYNYTVRDLTGIEALDPTREFPVDGAAGEGFTNAGSAQAMSPALVQKYFDAAKDVASHVVLLPAGIRFSPHVTERDRTDDLVAAIRQFYARFAVTKDVGFEVGGAGRVPNEAGIIPLDLYLAATIDERGDLSSGRKTIDEVARARKLNAKYLGTLWNELSRRPDRPSPLLDALREKWRGAKPADVGQLVQWIGRQQQVLFKYNTVGHIGKQGKPKVWMEAVTPIATSRAFNLTLPGGKTEDTSVFLIASDAGDGNEHDYVLWENPRLAIAGGREIPLRDLAGLQKRITRLQKEALAKTADYLAAVAEVEARPDIADDELKTLATKHGLDVKALRVWLNYLSIGEPGPVTITGHITQKHQNNNYDFVRGWGNPATPIVVGNASDRQVRIPGIARPRRIVVHPSPTLFVAAAWQAPISGLVKISANLHDAHPECGNGQEWFLQHRTKQKTGNLWKGDFATGGAATMTPKTISVRRGELVAFLVGPRSGEYTCDLTEVNLTITELAGEKRVWDLAKDCASDLQAANPHADRFGNDRVWHFFQGPMADVNKEATEFVSVPAGSVLAKWRQAKDAARRAELADQVQTLATGDPPADGATPDGALFEQLKNMAFSPHDLDSLLADVEPDPRFQGANLVVQAPTVVEFLIPAVLAEGSTFVATGRLEPEKGREGSVRLEVATSKIEPDALPRSNPVIVNDGSAARQRVEAAFAAFRELFPPAVCYEQIVPVDEVVTLTLWYRQDDALQRLMLDDKQIAELNRLWDELFYVAKEPLKYEVAFEQIRAFATQDRPDLVKLWKPLVKGVEHRAAEFRERLIDTEPKHLAAVILDFAERAWRRPLTDPEQQGLTDFYGRLRHNEIPHEEAIRLTIARVLTSPAFLYKLEQPAAGKEAALVSDSELATRLSYFLWSSMPDEELMQTAREIRLNASQRRARGATDSDEAHASGSRLNDELELLRQTRRMLKDPRTRRLAIQFACQWLHVRNFDQEAEKNEKLYPEFASLRGDMYEETVRFFADMFRNDGSILSMLDADRTFLNEALAKHYGIAGVRGAWQRVDAVRSHGRGGVLGMATVLASQSGASRTSPILRGNWVFETLLGQRLPKPPAGVPILPDEPPKGLTARQLIEQHSSAVACAKCHAKIDPYGFALEQYDAIGRLRPAAVDTKTKLLDGDTIDGLDGLRTYLLTKRRDDFVRQFCRKLLGYSLGREVLLSDRPLIDKMMKDLAENDYRFSVAVEAIVLSDQFRKIRGS